MDREWLKHAVAHAEHLVATTSQQVETMRKNIASRLRDGFDCKQAMEYLRAAERTLEAHISQRDRLIGELRLLDDAM